MQNISQLIAHSAKTKGTPVLVIFRGEEFWALMFDVSVRFSNKDRHLLSQSPFSYVLIV